MTNKLLCYTFLCGCKFVCLFAGSYCRVATAVMQMVRQGKEMESDPNTCLPIDDINSLFLELAPKCPMLMFKWCYILTLVNFGDQAFWAQILRTQPHDLILEQGYYEPVFNCSNMLMALFCRHPFDSILIVI